MGTKKLVPRYLFKIEETSYFLPPFLVPVYLVKVQKLTPPTSHVFGTLLGIFGTTLNFIYLVLSKVGHAESFICAT